MEVSEGSRKVGRLMDAAVERLQPGSFSDLELCGVGVKDSPFMLSDDLLVKIEREVQETAQLQTARAAAKAAGTEITLEEEESIGMMDCFGELPFASEGLGEEDVGRIGQSGPGWPYVKI